ncbi:hypothetical protein A3K73_07450 [Candidatus Pacearchaeota archaeon RBG_13_36_9]|nr:MAG: hypothetical protein A3K73_07450 [Candidatus Pacearchaeota archaeon RBG_13_36_9]
MDKLRYLLLTQKDSSSTISCVIKVFLYDEPMTKSLGMSESEFYVFAEAVCKKAVKDKLSYVCKNGNRVIGFALNDDMMGEAVPNSTGMPSKMNPILDLLWRLDNSYLKGKKISKKELFHLFMIGSLKEHRRKGIAKKLIVKSLALAKRKKFNKVITEATNMNSQKFLRKYFGFKDAKDIKYKEFKCQNKFLFKDIGEESCKLMALRLNEKTKEQR